MIQKLVWERFYDSEKGTEKLKIIKAEGVGFPADPTDPEGGEGNSDARAEHFKKYEVGTVIGIYDFLSDPDYYTKMYTIVHKSQKYVTNV